MRKRPGGPASRIVHQLFERVREGFRIGGQNQQAVDPVANQLGHSGRISFTHPIATRRRAVPDKLRTDHGLSTGSRRMSRRIPAAPAVR